MADYSELIAAQMQKYETYEEWKAKHGKSIEDDERWNNMFERAHGRRRGPGRPPKEESEAVEESQDEPESEA